MLGLLSLTIILYHLTWGRIRVKRRKRHSFREPPSENKSRVRQRVREESEQHHESGENNPSQAGVDESQRNGDGVQVLPAQVEVQPCPSPSSSSTTDRGGTASSSPTIDSMETTDSSSTSKENTVHQDAKKNSNDDSQVCSAQGVVQPCPATSTSVTDCCGALSPDPANDCTAKDDSTLVLKVDLVRQDAKKNSNDDSQVSSVQGVVQPCPATSSSVRTDCRGAASPVLVNGCTAKTNSTLVPKVDLVRQDTKKNSDDFSKVPSAQVDVKSCPAISSSVRTDCRGAASPVLVNDFTAKTDSTLVPKVDLVRQDTKVQRNDSDGIKVNSTKPDVLSCQVTSSSSTIDCGGPVLPVLAKKNCTWSSTGDIIHRDTKRDADSILTVKVDVQPRLATSLSLTMDCGGAVLDNDVMAMDRILACKGDTVFKDKMREDNDDIQVRSANPAVQPVTSDCGCASSPVFANDNTARKDCAWTTIIDVFRRDPKGFADKVRSAFVDIKPRPAACLLLTENCSTPASSVPGTGFPAKTTHTIAFKGDMVQQVGKGFADEVSPAKMDVKLSPATCLSVMNCNGPASRDTVFDFPTNTNSNLASKSNMVHQFGKENADKGVQLHPATSLSLTMDCVGDASPAPVTDLTATTYSTLVSEDMVFRDTEIDKQLCSATSISSTTPDGAVSSVLAGDSMANTDSILVSKVDMVPQETKRDSTDDIQVFAPQLKVQACLTNSSPPTTECHGAASHIVSTNVMAKYELTSASKAGMVCQDTKRNCDDVQSCLTTSSLSTISCEGAAALVPATDFMAETDSTLTSKNDRNDEQISAPSFVETVGLLDLSSNSDYAKAASIKSRKNEGLCYSSDQYDTQALIEAAAKLKLPPQTSRRRKTTTGNLVITEIGRPTPRLDGNAKRLFDSPTVGTSAPIGQCIQGVNGRAFEDNKPTSLRKAVEVIDDTSCSDMMSKDDAIPAISNDENKIHTVSNTSGHPRRKRRFGLSSIKKKFISPFWKSKKEDEIPLLEDYD